MKKIISLALVLVLCLGIFAGCGDTDPVETEDTVPSTSDTQPTQTDPVEDDTLVRAVEYIYTMYKPASKNEPTKLTTDKEVLAGVVIDGVTYQVAWSVEVTSGAADSVTVTESSTPNMAKIDIIDRPAEELYYTATATVTNDKGESKSVSFDFYTPAAAGQLAGIADGTYVILYGNLTLSSLAQDKSYGYPYANEITVAGGAVSGHAAADVLTITNVDGGVTIQDAYGRYFYLKGTYNSFNVDTTAPAEGGHVWEVLKEGDAYMLVNALNKKTLAYSSTYSSWGAYPELTDDHNYLLTVLPASAPAEDPDPVDPDPVDPPASNDPAANSKLSIAEAIALGASKAHNTYTEGKYYVTGVITEVYNTQYGNMKITDDKGNILTIYGTYSADGSDRYDAMSTKPDVGDTVTIYGIIGQYNDTPQIKNGWIVEHTASGNSTPSDPVAPNAGNTGDVTLANGMKVVIYAPAYGKALSVEKTSHYNVGVDVTVDGSTLTGYGDTEIFTVIANDDGTWSFAHGGQNIGLANEYSSMNLGAVNDKWIVTSLGGGLYAITNVGRAGMSMEWYNQYSNWSTYSGDYTTDDQYQICFYVVE